MNKYILTLTAVAAFAATASAQMINVSLANGWTATPACQQIVNNFSSSNGAGGFMAGGSSAEVGTSLGVCYTRGAATAQGALLSGPPVTDGRTATAGTIEFYAHPTGGNVSVTLNAQPERAVRNLRGTGYSGRTTATVAVTCPYFGWLRATAITIASPPPGLASLQTVPVSASASATGQTSFLVNMAAGSTATGTVSLVGDAIQIFSGANATGTVTLN